MYSRCGGALSDAVVKQTSMRPLGAADRTFRAHGWRVGKDHCAVEDSLAGVAIFNVGLVALEEWQEAAINVVVPSLGEVCGKDVAELDVIEGFDFALHMADGFGIEIEPLGHGVLWLKGQATGIGA